MWKNMMKIRILKINKNLSIPFDPTLPVIHAHYSKWLKWTLVVEGLEVKNNILESEKLLIIGQQSQSLGKLLKYI